MAGDPARERSLWPLLAPSVRVVGFIEPMQWGRSRYSIVRVPRVLVDAAARTRTRRVAGEFEGEPVNLALTQAPVIPDVFVWAGASLQRRLGLRPGDAVAGWLAPVDPDHVPLPPEVAHALHVAGLEPGWDALTPSARRKLLAPIDAAASPELRTRRIAALLDSLRT